MTSIVFTIFGEPASKANSRQIVMRGRGETARPASIKSPKAIAYEKAAIAQIPNDAKAMIEGPVCVSLCIHYASERPDLDESVVLDVLQARFETVVIGGRETRVCTRKGVYLNDRQVREKHVFHRIDRTNPRVEIEVKPLQMQQEGLPL